MVSKKKLEALKTEKPLNVVSVSEQAINKAKQEKTTLTEQDVKALVKVETFKEMSAMIRTLSEQDMKIAEAYGRGDLQATILDDFKITKGYLDQLLTNPAFITELKRVTWQTGFADKDLMIRLNSRIGLELYESFMTHLGDLDAMPVDRKLKALKEVMELSQKLVEGNKVEVKVDMTQIINTFIKDEKRVKLLSNGEVLVESEYPELDEETDTIVGEWEYVDNDKRTENR